MNIRLATSKDEREISILISMFRVELKKLKGIASEPEIENAEAEFREYVSAKYPIFVAEDRSGKLDAYLVCKIIGNVVWVESIFVSEKERRKGIATQLYRKAEEVALDLSNSAPYNWVRPDNDKMIAFLKRLGYDVLNLIEVSKGKDGEKLTGKIRVGSHDYRY